VLSTRREFCHAPGRRTDDDEDDHEDEDNDEDEEDDGEDECTAGVSFPPGGAGRS
jgi:TATA-binding protein-associated factor Taf7